MQYTWHIVGAATIIAAQTVALTLLLFQRRRRITEERTLRDSMQTDRMQTEFLAREVSRRLIAAQEDERKRLAEDLLDDLNQRLAILSIELELLRKKVDPDAAHVHVDQISNSVKELASEIHKLSYGLHPAKLDQLGLVAAARTLCRDATQASGLQVQFSHDQIRRDIHPTLALSLYRVLQESLQNAVRYSGAGKVQVDLRAGENEIRLVVSDNGCGFDPVQAARGGGLGFIGMRERMRQVAGTFALDSAPGRGTRVEVCAPIALAPAAPLIDPPACQN